MMRLSTVLSRRLVANAKTAVAAKGETNLSMAMVLPITIPNRRVALNLGVQVNYNTPYTPTEFYNPPYWQTKSLHGPVTEEEANHTANSHVKRDLTAGQFYGILGEMLRIQGLDNEQECLLKAVCQMAEYPLIHGHDDLIEEVLHFIFTPSAHKSFADEEEPLRIAYEDAEAIGRQGGDCNLHFPNCYHSPIEKLTRLEEIGD